MFYSILAGGGEEQQGGEMQHLTLDAPFSILSVIDFITHFG